MSTVYRIPLSRLDLAGNEERYVSEAVRSSWVSSTGFFVDRAEEAVAEMAGTRYAVLTCNGTCALHLALKVLGIGQGHEVIVPTLTFVAVPNSVRYVGAEPVFVDVDERWCIDPIAIEREITSRTRAIIVVHSYGCPARMDEINQIAKINHLVVVEDAAEAHFAQYHGRVVGGLGDLGMFSFYGNKIVSSGEGGAVVTNDQKIAARARFLRGQGMDPQRRYYFPETGFNFRMTNVAAAILLAQLERGGELVAARRQVYGWYEDRLRGCELIELQSCPSGSILAPWLFSVLVSASKRDAVMAKLEDQGIETRPFFVPLHTLPMFETPSLPTIYATPKKTVLLAARGINLPTYPTLSEVEVDEVCAVLIATVKS